MIFSFLFSHVFHNSDFLILFLSITLKVNINHLWFLTLILSKLRNHEQMFHSKKKNYLVSINKVNRNYFSVEIQLSFYEQNVIKITLMFLCNVFQIESKRAICKILRSRKLNLVPKEIFLKNSFSPSFLLGTRLHETSIAFQSQNFLGFLHNNRFKNFEIFLESIYGG